MHACSMVLLNLLHQQKGRKNKGTTGGAAMKKKMVAMMRNNGKVEPRKQSSKSVP